MFNLDNTLIYIYIFLFIYLTQNTILNSTILKKKTKELGKKIYKTDNIKDFAESLFYLLTPYMIFKGYTFLLNQKYKPNISTEQLISDINLRVAIKNKNANEVSRILQDLKNTDIQKYNKETQSVLSFEIELYKLSTGKYFSLPDDKKFLDYFISIYQSINIDCRINNSNKCKKYTLFYHPDKHAGDPDATLKFQLFGEIRHLLDVVYKK